MIFYKPIWFLYFLGLGQSGFSVQGLDRSNDYQKDADFQMLFPGEFSVNIFNCFIYLFLIVDILRDTKSSEINESRKRKKKSNH